MIMYPFKEIGDFYATLTTGEAVLFWIGAAITFLFLLGLIVDLATPDSHD